jgi:hypothetical protein
MVGTVVGIKQMKRHGMHIYIYIYILRVLYRVFLSWLGQRCVCVLCAWCVCVVEGIIKQMKRHGALCIYNTRVCIKEVVTCL